ncbi:MlaD family protein [Nocardia harenae]|uniref:MlaD family protein n=1 Tax=Nocardia harenae TaxID=358707 RepID=UPI00082D4803|nr:MlaD family protein [Nocardia harenae]
MSTAKRSVVRAGAALICGFSVLVSSCALGPKDIPTFGSDTGGERIRLHFAGVMNLPDGATVTMDGLEIGKVAGVEAGGADVTVTVSLEPGARVPADSRAIIRQDTLLGDTYIALDHAPTGPGTEYLAPDGIVPVSRTTSPPQLEDTLAVLAYFVNGGSIERIQTTVSRINSVMPAVDEIRRLSTVLTGDLRDLSQNTGEIDRTLAGLDRTASAISDRSPTLDRVMFDDAALRYWRYAADIHYGQASTGLPAIGSLFVGGNWLVPMLNSLAAAVHAGSGTWSTAPAAVDSVATFLRMVVLPFARNPSVNIRSVQAANGDELVGDMENLLRVLGAIK